MFVPAATKRSRVSLAARPLPSLYVSGSPARPGLAARTVWSLSKQAYLAGASAAPCPAPAAPAGCAASSAGRAAQARRPRPARRPRGVPRRPRGVPRGKLVWPHLKNLRLDDIWASEQGFFSIFKDHQYSLEFFSLGNATIVQGSWRSLFTKIRALEPKCQISADGELYGRRSKDTLFMNHAALTLLRGFIRDRQAPWPFSF